MKIPMCVQYGWRASAVTGTQSVWTGTEATMLWLKTPSWEWLMIKWSMMVTKIQIILRIARGWFGSAHTWAHHCQAHMSSQLQPLSSRFLSCEGVLKKQLQERKYIMWQKCIEYGDDWKRKRGFSPRMVSRINLACFGPTISKMCPLRQEILGLTCRWLVMASWEYFTDDLDYVLSCPLSTE